jgi:hypothetical protein
MRRVWFVNGTACYRKAILVCCPNLALLLRQPGWREAIERRLGLDVMDAGVAVKGFIPEAMSLRDIGTI